MKRFFKILIYLLIISIVCVIVLISSINYIINSDYAKTKINDFLIENYELYITYDNISIKIFSGITINNFKCYIKDDDILFYFNDFKINYDLGDLIGKRIVGSIYLNNFNLKNDNNDISTNGELSVNLNNNEIIFNLALDSNKFNIEDFIDFTDTLFDILPEADTEPVDDTDVPFVLEEYFKVHTNINVSFKNIYYPEYFSTSFTGNIGLNPIIVPPSENDNVSSGRINLRIPSIIINNNEHLKKTFNKLKMEKYEERDYFKTDAISSTILLNEGNFYINRNEIKIDDIVFLINGKVHITGTGNMSLNDKETNTAVLDFELEEWELQNWNFNERYLVEILKREALSRLYDERDRLIERGREFLDEKVLDRKDELIDRGRAALEKYDSSSLKDKASGLLDTDTVDSLKDRVSDYIDTDTIDSLRERVSDYVDSDTLKKVEEKAKEILQDEETKERIKEEADRLLRRFRR